MVVNFVKTLISINFCWMRGLNKKKHFYWFLLEINEFLQNSKTLNNIIFVNSCKKGLFYGTVLE